MNFWDQVHSTPLANYYYPILNGRWACVIVPTGYKPSGKVIVHMHGLRIAEWDSAKDKKGNPKEFEYPGSGTIEYFKFGDHLPKDTLMVCPVSFISNYTLDDWYPSCRNVLSLLQDVTLQTGTKFTDVTLSAHSAGGRVLSPLLRGGTTVMWNGKRTNLPVTKVWLFDALYNSDISAFKEWLIPNDRYLWSVAKVGTSTYKNALPLQKLSGTKVLGTTMNHWNLVRDSYFKMFVDDSQKK